MAISGLQVINIGLQNEAEGSDSLYTAFNKTKDNFTTLFACSSSFTTFTGNTGISTSSNSSTGTVTITNTGVTSIIAGTNVSIDQANGNVTVSVIGSASGYSGASGKSGYSGATGAAGASGASGYSGAQGISGFSGASGGGSGDKISNGTSNVSILTVNGNVTVGVNGNANVAVFNGTGLVAANLRVSSSNITLGANAGIGTGGTTSIAIGSNAASNAQGANSIAIGVSAGTAYQGDNSITIGTLAANSGYQGSNSIAIGTYAGGIDQDNTAIAIGVEAGGNNQGSLAIAIGPYAGLVDQGIASVAIGEFAGSNTQSTGAVAVGESAGKEIQGEHSVAIGSMSAFYGQGNLSTALGYEAAANTQGDYSIALGAYAGHDGQGANSIAIGYNAGYTNQHTNTTIINSTGSTLDSTSANSLYIAPIRNASSGNVLYYDATTKEITYSTSSGGANLGNLTASNVTLSATTPSWPVKISSTSTGSNYWYNAYGGNVLIDQYTDFWMYTTGVTTDTAGNIYTVGGNDGDFGIPYLLKYDQSGSLLWDKSITSDSNKWFYGQSIVHDSTGNVIITIENEDDSLNGYHNVVKLNSSGTIVWQTAPQLSAPYTNGYTRILTTIDSSDNIYVVIGSPAYSLPYSENGFNIAKYNSAGTLQWQLEIDSYTSGFAFANIGWTNIQVDSSGNVYILGQYTAAVRQAVLYKINSSGSTVQYVGMPALIPSGLTFDSSGNIYLSGAYVDYSDASSPSIACIIKYDSNLGQQWGIKLAKDPFPGYSGDIYGIKYDSGTLYAIGNGDGIMVFAVNAADGSIIWQNLLTTEPTNVNATIYDPYSTDMSSLITVTSDSILISGVTDSQEISDMLTVRLPKDGTGLGQDGYFIYMPLTATFDSLVASGAWTSGATASNKTIVDSANYASVTNGTYSNYKTSIDPAGDSEWQFTANNGIVFPDGSTQPKAINPYEPTTFYNLTVTGQFNVDLGFISLGTGSMTSIGGVTIGGYAGQNRTKNRYSTVAIGPYAQQNGNGNYAVAIGASAGQSSRDSAIAIGPSAGATEQGNTAISIGGQAGITSQRDQAVAIGFNAGFQNQGNSAIALGHSAGYNDQANNSIVINATGTGLDNTTANSLVVKPIRNASAANALYYNPTSGEITYDVGGGGGGGNTISKTTWTGSPRTLQLTDPGTYVYTTEASNKTLYIPTNAETAIPVNSVINVLIKSANYVSVIANSGVTLYMVGSSTTGNRTINGYGMATLLKTETDVWFISGTGVY